MTAPSGPEYDEGRAPADALRATFEAFGRTTRYGSMVLAIDMRSQFRELGLEFVASDDALRHINSFAAAGFEFVVVAGPLHAKRGGAFVVGVKAAGGLPVLGSAIVTATTRLEALGERSIMVGLLVDDELVEPLMELVALLQPTEANA